MIAVNGYASVKNVKTYNKFTLLNLIRFTPGGISRADLAREMGLSRAAISSIALFYLGAPRELVAAFVAALLAIVIYMSINLWWKISVHTGFAAASITVLFVLYGTIGVVTAALLPLIGWSRIELEHHSPIQVVVGALMASLIVVVVFHLFGLVRPIVHV